ncbi:MAG: CHAD domain-containing protein [Deltaproteobacteria bacterium]|nr:CHAD domain-containing protein [Deltaproteobacteria bacterium]
MRLDPETLDRLPDEGARVVCLALCAAAEEAGRRVAGGEDEEALHDFRVALRRLRSALRAFAPLLGDLVPAPLRRELRELGRATGPARDAEVLHGWLSGLGDAVPERYRPARDWLAARVEAARGEAYDQVEEGLVPRFAEAAPALAQRLAAGGAPGGATETFGASLAGLLRGHVLAVREALQAVEVPADAAEAHRARIEVKRLRYLLEPLRGNARADAGEAVRGLKALQEVLGQLSDAHQAAAELAAALVVAAAERARGEGDASLRPGLLFLERLAVERTESHFARLRDDWLGGGAGALFDRVFEVVAALEWRDAEEAEPEQRLLLADLPPEGRGDATEELWQGWLASGREGYGRVAGPDGERFFRSTSQGKGAARFEAVEESTREAFEDYWPLTEGRRIHKRRHRPAAAPGWAFDEYLDRKLVLAVAVDGGGAAVPQWLEPVFVRDVTRERGYGDEALARRGKGK